MTIYKMWISFIFTGKFRYRIYFIIHFWQLLYIKVDTKLWKLIKYTVIWLSLYYNKISNIRKKLPFCLCMGWAGKSHVCLRIGRLFNYYSEMIASKYSPEHTKSNSMSIYVSKCFLWKPEAYPMHVTFSVKSDRHFLF